MKKSLNSRLDTYRYWFGVGLNSEHMDYNWRQYNRRPIIFISQSKEIFDGQPLDTLSNHGL